MKVGTLKFVGFVSVLSALIGVSVIFMATMTGHDKYREKLIRQPVRPIAGSLQVAASYPQKTKDKVLLLEIEINAEKNDGQAAVIWNGSEIDRIPAYGHHFVRIPKTSFLEAGNTLSLQGLATDSVVATLEIKNLYGFSTGVLQGVMVLPGSASLKRLPLWLALALAALLMVLPLAAPHTMSLAAKNRCLRYGAAAVIVFFLAILAMPLLFAGRVYLGLPTTAILLAAIYWPGLWRVIKAMAALFQSRVQPWIKRKLLRLDFSPLEWKILGGLALAAIFIFYAANRQRYVGAADWYGYYAESLLFRQGQLTMKTAYPPAQYPAFAPLGFYVAGDKIIPQYPPGFPLLMALFGLMGLEFYVNALAGVLTVLLLYLILRNSVSRGMALLFASLWAFLPIAMYISVRIMSDLVATLFILIAYYSFTRNKIFWSGVAFSYAVVVRPISVLFFIIFLPLLFKKKKFWHFCFSAGIIGFLYGLYNWAVFGKPWMTGYQGVADELTGTVFFHHFVYYGKTILILMTPLLLIPALLALMRRKPRSLFYFSWLGSFWLFYSFWKSGADSWWYLRFLLPGLPALFILSAIGMQDIRAQLLAWKPRWQKLPQAAAFLILLLLLPYFIAFSDRNWVFSADKGEMYYQATKKMQSLVPPDALVGGIETSGPIRLYAGMESFRWDQPQSFKLMYDFLKKKRPLYLLIEPWNKQHPIIEEIAQTFNVKHIAIMPDPMGTLLAQVSLREE
ncbi:MAG: hypothetical protein NTW95_01595 [Candidatus Aminicenantes bacterium]|nr:hypothetical protein [Candidatus Aminicenantes bacterium]